MFIMLNIEIDESKVGIEIYIDTKGIEELIEYLNFIKSSKDHIHLVTGNELDELIVKEGKISVKHVKQTYIDELKN